MQDAVVKVGGHPLAPGRKAPGRGAQPVRLGGRRLLRLRVAPRRSALRFERVLACKCRNVIRRQGRGAQPAGGRVQRGRAAGGSRDPFFSGGGGLRLEVECLECELADLGPDLDRGQTARSIPTTRFSPGLTRVGPAPLMRVIGPGPRAEHSMPIRLDTRAPDFAARFKAFSRPSGKPPRTSSRWCAPSSPTSCARGDQALVELTRKFDRFDPDVGRPAGPADEIDAALAGCDRDALDALTLARDRIEAYHRRQLPRGRSLHRRARRRARLALDRDRGGRPLRAGRHRRLSVLGADERGAGQGRRRAARRHGRADAGRQAQSAGAGGREARRRRRDLSRRRRAGGRGARLRHRDDRAGRQDRRPRQRLCRGGQAPGVRHGRHRHDRRAVRGADRRRRRRNPDWIAADLLAQAEHDAAAQSILITDDAALADAVEARSSGSSTTLPRARDRRRRPGAIIGAIILVRDARRRRCRWSTRIAPEHLEIDDRRSPSALARPHPQRRRDLPRPPHAGSDRRLCRRARTTCCRRRARRASRPAWRARLHEAHVDPQMRARPAARARPGGDRARRGRRSRRPCALGGDPPQSR